MNEQQPSQGPPQNQQPPQSPYGQAPVGVGASPPQAQPRQVPRCMRCGTVTRWKPAPLLRVLDIVIIGMLFLLFGVGLVYLIVMLIFRSNPNNREKICPICGNDQWTFIY